MHKYYNLLKFFEDKVLVLGGRFGFSLLLIFFFTFFFFFLCVALPPQPRFDWQQDYWRGQGGFSLDCDLKCRCRNSGQQLGVEGERLDVLLKFVVSVAHYEALLLTAHGRESGICEGTRLSLVMDNILAIKINLTMKNRTSILQNLLLIIALIAGITM